MKHFLREVKHSCRKATSYRCSCSTQVCTRRFCSVPGSLCSCQGLTGPNHSASTALLLQAAQRRAARPQPAVPPPHAFCAAPDLKCHQRDVAGVKRCTVSIQVFVITNCCEPRQIKIWWRRIRMLTLVWFYQNQKYQASREKTELFFFSTVRCLVKAMPWASISSSSNCLHIKFPPKNSYSQSR